MVLQGLEGKASRVTEASFKFPIKCFKTMFVNYVPNVGVVTTVLVGGG